MITLIGLFPYGNFHFESYFIIIIIIVLFFSPIFTFPNMGRVLDTHEGFILHPFLLMKYLTT
jgi:hypothetical protein